MALDTALVILYQSLLIFPLILGGFYSIVLMRLPDLALEAAFLMGASVSVLSMAFLPPEASFSSLFLLLVLSSLAGMCVGFATSFLREALHISHLFASIIAIGFFGGFSRFLLGAPHVSLLSYPSYLNLFPRLFLKPELLTLGILAFFLVLLHRFVLKTQFGLAVEIYGANKLFFKFHHIKEKFIGYAGTLLAHGLAGMSGFLVCQSHGFVDISLGAGIGLQVITALLFGVICSERLSFSRVYQPIAGGACYFTLHGLLLLSGFDLTYFNALQAIAVAVCCFYRQFYLKSASLDKVQTYGLGV